MNLSYRRKYSAFGLLAALVFTHVNADTVFTNGSRGASGDNYFAQPEISVYQDFILGSATDLTALTFNGITFTGSTQPITAITVKVYSDNSGAIGAELHSGSFAIDSYVYTGAFLPGADFYDFRLLLPNWSLGVGNYWVSLAAAPSQWDLHWTDASNNLGSGTYGWGFIGSSGAPGIYYQTSEKYFSLEDSNSVPEVASTLILLGTSFLGFALFRRKFVI